MWLDGHILELAKHPAVKVLQAVTSVFFLPGFFETRRSVVGGDAIPGRGVKKAYGLKEGDLAFGKRRPVTLIDVRFDSLALLRRESHFHAREFGSIVGRCEPYTFHLHLEFVRLVLVRVALRMFGDQCLANHTDGFKGYLLAHAMSYQEGHAMRSRATAGHLEDWREFFDGHGNPPRMLKEIFEFWRGASGGSREGGSFFSIDGRGFRSRGTDLEIRSKRHGIYLVRKFRGSPGNQIRGMPETIALRRKESSGS